MKSKTSRWLARGIVLAAAALSFSAVQVHAQATYHGKFTLPVEAHWGAAVLPAGEYTFTMASSATPYVLYVRGEKASAIVLASAAETSAEPKRSELTLMSSGGVKYVRSLAAPDLGLTLVFTTPKEKSYKLARVKAPRPAQSTDSGNNWPDPGP